MLVVGSCIHAIVNKELCEVNVTTFGYPVQRSLPTLVPGCCIRTMFDQKLYKLGKKPRPFDLDANTALGRPMKRSLPTLVPGCYVGAMLD
jgi:hypothetical protein